MRVELMRCQGWHCDRGKPCIEANPPERVSNIVGDFPDAVLNGVRGRGQAIKVVGQHDQIGHWAGIRIDPDAHTLAGGVNSKLNGLVEGY